MNLYTHAFLAKRLQTIVQPADPAEYLWGALAPDIRYLAAMRRETTHLPDETLRAWLEAHPAWTSFIQGYRVHCLLDRIDAAEALLNAFPMRWLRGAWGRQLTPHQVTVVIELYYQLRAPRGLELRGAHNPILESLGVQAGQSEAFVSALAVYLRQPSFQNAAKTFALLGIIEDTRLEKYLKAYRGLRRNPLRLAVLAGSAHNARLEQSALAQWRELTR